MREVYCDRLADVIVSARDQHFGRCAECNAWVTSPPAPDVRLVCIPCLTRNAEPTEPLVVHSDRGHCAECFLANRPLH